MIYYQNKEYLNTILEIYIQYFLVLQIVGIGLCGVFNLVRETREHYPELCVKAMKALLNMLQGQLPESMKQEPADVVGMLLITSLPGRYVVDTLRRSRGSVKVYLS